MKKYIAFLRAINVGGHNVKMDELRTLFEDLGLLNVETFIASGNVIFESKTGNIKTLENKIEDHLQKSLGYEVATFIRTDAEVAEIAVYKAFSENLIKTSKAYIVGFLAEPLSKEAAKKLMNLKTEIDDFHTNGKEVYWLCKLKQSDSKFNNNAFEKSLGVKATFRNINTIQRLSAKYPV